jgi:hypothetical protein
MQEVIKQIKNRYKVDLQSQDINYQLWRLDDTEYIKLQKNSLSIANNFDFHKHLYLSREEQNDKLNLAEILTVLECLLGESSDLYDKYKGAFYFPTLLVVIKTSGTFYYLMDIYDHRGWLYFRLYRIVNHDYINIQDPQILRETFSEEFTQQEINYFLFYFYGYLIGCFRTFEKFNSVKPFLKRIDSNLILYGYKDQEFFEKHCDSEENYQAEIESFEKIYGNSLNKIDVNAILQTITSEYSEI